MKQASGKFVIRVGTELHEKLRKLSQAQGLSLNALCKDILEKHLAIGTDDLCSPEWIELIKKTWKTELSGLVLFGSYARGDTHTESDMDLLIILKSHIHPNRNQYKLWDKISENLPIILSPHFVSLPLHHQDVGGLWYEVALDGTILWEEDKKISSILREIRHKIAEGSIIRKTANGHPYWIKEEHA